MQVDRNARSRRAREDMVDQEFYGRLERIVHLQLLPSTQAAIQAEMGRQQALLERQDRPVPHVLQQPVARDHILVSIRSARLNTTDTGLKDLDVTYVEGFNGSLDVVDAIALQCLVGRVYDSRRWAFIDRSGGLVRTEGGNDFM
ncbi:hypothetical protein CYLTODRAFT_427804 [Cylindrobasidium torrendii FP15055 ss-10]|uniref:Uncharacterized protein n=1 Tax=Cylindrobasidium torrendii FP15055 ss-10 TaxID=1314674 RepID=A0A0D7AQM1_9AGAR|nr:hypothetical protein CYLTODRAFT_427804 [Cylindrobasidium torrendii FP15055 ss-10]